ncbi:NADH dehydrogenase [ubiquinone] 1 beta subcomplex subunit 2 [Platanthera zijinensis]|uniref:NADH dehydrogenase [ubiquinone] 1 beta subcomplex subunit 2 n=1 Tax=Platanthera zijinensis TaxID=2320716 RepID=A0AAP0BMK0_9ASPA
MGGDHGGSGGTTYKGYTLHAPKRWHVVTGKGLCAVMCCYITALPVEQRPHCFLPMTSSCHLRGSGGLESKADAGDESGVPWGPRGASAAGEFVTKIVAEGRERPDDDVSHTPVCEEKEQETRRLLYRGARVADGGQMGSGDASKATRSGETTRRGTTGPWWSAEMALGARREMAGERGKCHSLERGWTTGYGVEVSQPRMRQPEDRPPPEMGRCPAPQLTDWRLAGAVAPRSLSVTTEPLAPIAPWRVGVPA